MPYSGTERSLMNLFFGVGGQKVKKNWFNDVKSIEIFINDIQKVEKCLVRAVLTNYRINVPFWGPHIPLKHCLYLPLNVSRQGALFKLPYDHILSDDCLTKKVGKLVKTQKFCLHRLSYLFFLIHHILIFIWCTKLHYES